MAQDIQILLNATLGLLRLPQEDLIEYPGIFTARGEFIGERRIGDQGVVLRDALLRSALGRMLEVDVDNELRDRVAPGDPGAIVGRAAAGRRWSDQENG